MSIPTDVTLHKLSDTQQTIASPDEDIRGKDVKDRDGEDIGKVDDLVIDDAEEKVRFMVVAHGGFLGLGEKKSFVPIDAITRIDDDVHIDQSGKHLVGAPRYEPDLAAKPDYYSGLYAYYGFGPFWGTGYVYPPYPYYR